MGAGSDTSIRRTRFENGLRVVTESVRDVASVAVGVWVENGSRDEEESFRGGSHFIEHLLFKGTHKRTAFQVAEEIESVGGSINAFTGKEYTCYHARVPAAHAETALDVLSDIFHDALFRSEDVEVEREVILQEIFDGEDTADEYIHDYHLESYWPGHPLGWAVAGTIESVSSLTRDDMVKFMRERYRPDRVLVTAAGAVDHDRFVNACRTRFTGLSGSYDRPAADKPDFNPGVFVCNRDLEQVHILLGLPGVSMVDPRRYGAELLVSALGGGMSSRLFQQIREERGRAYSIYAFQASFRDIGYTGVYAATSKEAVGEVVDLVVDNLSQIAAKGLDKEELERTKSQLTGSIPLSLESTESRMYRLARNHIYMGREVPISDVIEMINSTTMDDIIELAGEMFSLERLGIALLGDADERMVSLPAA